MRPTLLALTGSVLALSSVACRPPAAKLEEAYAERNTSAAKVDHSLLDKMLRSHVDAKGRVDYAKLHATQPRVPIPLAGEAALEEVLMRVFARMDKLAFGSAVCIVGGCYVMLATLFLVLKGGDVVGPHMILLGQVFFGYTVTLKGTVIGFLYGFLWGFMLGWTIAYLRNACLGFYLFYLKRRADAQALRNFLKFI